MQKYTLSKKNILTLLLTPLSLLALPKNPSNLQLQALSENEVLIKWQDNSTDERGFKIFRDGVQIKTVPKNITTFTDTGLKKATTYTYKVVATDDYLWYQPTKDTSWQWQLSGTINENYAVDLYDVDLFDTDVQTIRRLKDSGKKVICYFSAGSYEEWREDAEDFPVETLGDDLDGWAGEKWLDISSDAVRPIMINRLELAKQKGCDGVEPDNVDGYDNDTGFDLTSNQQLSYNLFLADEAHKRGLSIGLKNDLSQITDLESYFDFAVNEQCHMYKECNYLNQFIYNKKPVLHAEYEDKYKNNTNGARDILCQDSHVFGFNTLILPNLLDDTFRYSCKDPASTANLLFKSGFEGNVSISSLFDYSKFSEEGEDFISYYKNIEGVDGDYSWPISIFGSNESALHFIEKDTIGDLLETDIVSILGHHNSMTHALYSFEKGKDGSTQNPYEIFIPEEEGRKDLHIKYWIKLDRESNIKPNMWRTFFEYKTVGYSTGDGFRLISYIYTDSDGKPYWHWQGDDDPQDESWSIDNRYIPVPLDEWFLTEFYWHFGEGEDARALWKINGNIVGYMRKPTTKNNQPINFIMLTQIYGNSNPKYQWIDDIEIWDGLHLEEE
jgi:hypothetical protein